MRVVVISGIPKLLGTQRDHRRSRHWSCPSQWQLLADRNHQWCYMRSHARLVCRMVFRLNHWKKLEALSKLISFYISNNNGHTKILATLTPAIGCNSRVNKLRIPLHLVLLKLTHQAPEINMAIATPLWDALVAIRVHLCHMRAPYHVARQHQCKCKRCVGKEVPMNTQPSVIFNDIDMLYHVIPSKNSTPIKH